jgi:hypothetical protein
MKSFFNRVRGMSTFALFMLPIVFGLLISLVMGWVANKYYPHGLPPILLQIVGICIFFLWGSSGIVLVARKEWPTMTWISLRGNPAMIIGLLFIIFWWGLALMGLVKIIQIILKG